MRATTLRFDDELWAVIEAEAERAGVSAAQFLRDAAVMRAAIEAQRRGDRDAELQAADLATRKPRGKRQNPLAAITDPARLAELERLDLLDSSSEPELDRYTALASKVLNAPVALISLVDAERQLFKSRRGLPEPWQTQGETPLSHSFCQYAVSARAPLVVTDAREHPLVRDNLAIRDLDVIAYAGAPIITSAGHAVGSLCVIDSKPRHWTSDQIEILTGIAASVAAEIELRALRRGRD